MNKIRVVDEQVIFEESDDLIEVSLSDKLDIFDVIKLQITVRENTNIEIHFENEKESKMDIVFNIEENVHCNLYELKEEHMVKVQYKYYLKESSNLTVHKFYNCDTVKELDIVELNGIYATIKYIFHTISTGKQKYNLMLYHNSSNTKSEVINKGVNIEDGALSFNVTGVVYNGLNDCEVSQNNRIITMNENPCNINPNLLIEENDVSAKHAALIGKFNEEEIFYLMSRGISREESIRLLTRGFLRDETVYTDEIQKIIDTYWR